MKIKVLGASGAENKGYSLPSYLIDDNLLLDAGSVTASLSLKEQFKIKNVLISHSHLDHIKDLAFLADNFILNSNGKSFNIASSKAILHFIKENIFNDTIWPDFTLLPSKQTPVVRFLELTIGIFNVIENYIVLPVEVSHSVEALGYIIKGQREYETVLYTGDTGPTELIWRKANEYNVKYFITEVSFPNSLTELAIKFGHLTPRLLEREFSKLDKLPEAIFITHIKPQFEEIITEELGKIALPIEILNSGRIIEI